MMTRTPTDAEIKELALELYYEISGDLSSVEWEWAIRVILRRLGDNPEELEDE